MPVQWKIERRPQTFHGSPPVFAVTQGASVVAVGEEGTMRFLRLAPEALDIIFRLSKAKSPTQFEEVWSQANRLVAKESAALFLLEPSVTATFAGLVSEADGDRG